MKVILNDSEDFAEIEMSHIPSSGDIVFLDDNDYTVVSVEYCIEDGELRHVNLIVHNRG